MATIGYKRVSAADQRTDRQLDGIELDKVFEDQASGKNTERPQLQLLMDYARDGDTIVVHSMDRLARNLKDLQNLITHFNGKGAAVRFLQENLTFTGDDDPVSVLLMNVIGAVYQFERSISKARQREGIELARKRGAYKGRVPYFTHEYVEEIRYKMAQGIPKSKIADGLKISRRSLYRILEKYKDE